MKKLKHRITITVLLCLFVTIGIFYYRAVVRNISSLIGEQMKTYANLASSYAVGSVFDGISYGDLYTVTLNGDGSVALVAANGGLINKLNSDIQTETYAKLEELCERSVSLPLGVFLGVSAFSNVGPDVSIDCMRAGAVNCCFDSRFEAVGINQIKHTLYIEINSSVKSLFKISENAVNIRTYALVADNVIAGKIPEVMLIPNTYRLDLVP